MAFEIGQRVSSSFTGPGTVVGELHKDEDRKAFQLIHFDSERLGTRDWAIQKLSPHEDPPAKKERKGGKAAARGGDGTQA